MEARPRQLAVAAATGKPFSPDAHDLVVIPAQSLAVSRDAIVGAVPPDHSRQAGVLFAEGPVQIAPTPFRHSREGALVTVFRRYLTHNGLALPGRSPDMGEAEEVEGRPVCRRMSPLRAFEPEVHEAGLGRMERKPEPLKPLTQHGKQPLAGLKVLEGYHRVVSIADQLTSPF